MFRLYAFPPFLLQTAVWIPTRIVLRYFYHLEIKGLEHIKDLQKGVIFTANHTSEMDSVLIPASLPFLSRLMPMFYTCREKSFYKHERFGWKQHIYGGLFFTMWGAHEVRVGKNDYEYALQNHSKILHDGHSVCIFPEGRKNVLNEVIEPKGGVAYLSYKTRCPIVPVGISGAIEKKKIIVSFGKPLYPKDLFKNSDIPQKQDFKNAAKMVMSKVKELLRSV
jgi:1-acyl-sn-glycerol-3-phosphate acyltransferase